jgi:DNA uptake protein ComE-like DNA-binding protein
MDANGFRRLPFRLTSSALMCGVALQHGFQAGTGSQPRSISAASKTPWRGARPRLETMPVLACLLLGWAAMGSPAVAAQSEAGRPTALKPAVPLDLNTATREQLQELPGIGPAYAKRIVARRPYASVRGLTKTGIPAAIIEKIAPLVTVSSTKPQKPARNKETPSAKAEDPTKKSVKKSDQSDTAANEATSARPPAKGMVWVNTQTKVFHKEGSRWYGKTKEGKWMTEEEAIKDGSRAAKNTKAGRVRNKQHQE